MILCGHTQGIIVHHPLCTPFQPIQNEKKTNSSIRIHICINLTISKDIHLIRKYEEGANEKNHRRNYKL